MSTKISIKQLEVIKTPDGELFPVYRDWDEWHDGHVPKMAYITTMRANAKKGVILHRKRTAYITAVSGHVHLEYFDKELKTQQLSDEDTDQHWIMKIPPGIPILLVNNSANAATVLNLPTPSWHPDDQDTYKFNDWTSYFESESK